VPKSITLSEAVKNWNFREFNSLLIKTNFAGRYCFGLAYSGRNIQNANPSSQIENFTEKCIQFRMATQ
jgi:hypothetical protein